MSRSSEMPAAILKNAAGALAGYAVSELFESHPEAQASFPWGPFSGWQGLLAERIEELSAAVASGRPELFCGQVRWTSAILAARGVPLDLFRASLESLRGVLAKEVSSELSGDCLAYLDQALSDFARGTAAASPRLSADTPYGRLATQYLLAILEGDRVKAAQLVLDRAQAGEKTTDLTLQVLLPAQHELGCMWAAGEINVAEEHFATATTRMVMTQLRSFALLLPCHGKTVLAAAVAGNQHDLGVQAIADFFEMDGWRVVFLGANVPLEDLVQAVETFSPDLVALSVSLTIQLPTLKATMDAIRRSDRARAARILVGGHVFDGVANLAMEVGADGFAPEPLAALSVGRTLVGLPESSPLTDAGQAKDAGGA
jgi:methanogenic corrinoid protein MtbC1